MRNRLSTVLVSIGILFLLFGLLWWLVAVKRLVLYEDSQEYEVIAIARVDRHAAMHGLLSYSPPQTYEYTMRSVVRSRDEDYTSSRAVMAEDVEVEGATASDPLDLERANVYVMDRRTCENLKSAHSGSDGHPVDRSGSWYLNFPLGTGRENYNMFDNDVASSFAVSYREESRQNDLKAYVFSGSFRHRPMVDYRAEAYGLPRYTTFGAIKQELEAAGIPLEEIIESAYSSLTPEERETIESYPDDLMVRLEYTVKKGWEAAVDPTTGTIVKVIDDRTSIFVNTDVAEFLPLLEILASHAEDPLVSRYLSQVDQLKIMEPKLLYEISASWNDATTEERVDYANSRKKPIRFTRYYTTYASLLLGAIAFIAGLVIRRERQHSAGKEDGGPVELPRESAPRSKRGD